MPFLILRWALINRMRLSEIAVIGPTASMLPDALFERGVRVVGGVWVKKPNELLDVLAAGGSGYHFFDNLAPRIVIERVP